MKIPFAIWLMLLSLSDATCFGRRRSQKSRREQTPSEKNIFYDPLNDPNVSMDDHHCDCDTESFGVVQKIPYLYAGSDAIDINFSSVCIRCGMCAAIAQKINETLLEVHDMMMPETWLNKTQIELLIRAICDFSFKYYSLREFDGKRYISDRVPGANLISTAADGQWGEKLRTLCHDYLNEIGEVRLYEHWKAWCKAGEKTNEHDLINILCRSAFFNVLRDCRRMENVHNYELPCQNYYARMKILAEFDKYT